MDADVRAAHRTGLLDRVFHGSRVGMLVARFADGAVLEANDTFAALIGRPLVEILASNVYDLEVWGEHGAAGARRILGDPGLIDGYDTTVRGESGDTRIVRVWAETVVDADTVVVIRASDVDGRATAGSRYAELRETEVRYRAMVEQMPAITYTQVDDPTTETGFRDLYVSPQTRELLGVEPEAWLADPNCWVTMIHDEDRERVLAEIRDTQTGRFRSEYRMVARD